jgi:hypothetical protein
MLIYTLEDLPILEMIGKLNCIINSPNNRHIIAKIFIKYFYPIINQSVILQNAAIAGHQSRQFANHSQDWEIGLYNKFPE